MKKQLTEAQTRAALAACRKFREKRDNIRNSRTLDTVVYSMSANVELIPYDAWILKIRVGTGSFTVTGGDPEQAIDKAMRTLSASLPGQTAEPKKRGPKPGPRQPKDGATAWSMRELDTMRILAESIMPDVFVKEAQKTIDGVSVVVTVMLGHPCTVRARVVGSRTKVLVTQGATRQEALTALMLRNA